jgi:hypothetical protein
VRLLLFIFFFAVVLSGHASDRFTDQHRVRVLQGSGVAIRGVGVTRMANFVKTIYPAGYWNQLTIFPLQTSQNSGTGSVAYAFGGVLATGTLTNGPSWSGTGIILSGTNQYIATSLLQSGTSISIASLAQSTKTGASNNSTLISSSVAGNNGIWVGLKSFSGTVSNIVNSYRNSGGLLFGTVYIDGSFSGTTAGISYSPTASRKVFGVTFTGTGTEGRNFLIGQDNNFTIGGFGGNISIMAIIQGKVLSASENATLSTAIWSLSGL